MILYIFVPLSLFLAFLLIQWYYINKERKQIENQDNTPKYGKNRAEIEKLLELDKTEMETWHKN